MPPRVFGGEGGGFMRYDYVIVGGGSAGCVLANRLSADGKHSVCLLEAGPADSNPFIAIPGGILQIIRSKLHNWHFFTEPQRHLDNRPRYWPRGKTLGGSSAINAMCYIRGHARDYDHWASLGNTGWSYRDLLPLFRKSEHHEIGANDFHGTGGPLNVAPLRDPSPLAHAFIEAAEQAGFRRTADFNGAQQEGVGLYEVMQKNGQRCSNAHAFLREAEGRENLTIRTGVHATRVLFDGKRAVGVRVFESGRYLDIAANREVLLAAGAIGSPQLLLLSGVGPRDEIQRHGISLVHELPGVGRNLQDHPDFIITTENTSRLAISFHPLAFWRTIVAVFQYLFKKRGTLTSNSAEAGAFTKSSPSEPIPDLQYHLVVAANTRHAQDLSTLFKFCYSLHVCILRPKSRGTVTLRSSDALAAPVIQPNYCEHPEDFEKLVLGFKQARHILSQPAWTAHRGAELEPGMAVQSDEHIRAWVRANTETVYHPVGTCKMGLDDMAVVDSQLRVRGIEGLRVIDASIMPTLIGGNTNAPTTVIGEKGAAMILEQALSRPAATALAA
ncbi:MAG TPA: choline dehydrogenase [Verrucomicrobiae bacterium]|nr:choline dehydrogenase [Verrucomicrobiae bacterium]